MEWMQMNSRLPRRHSPPAALVAGLIVLAIFFGGAVSGPRADVGASMQAPAVSKAPAKQGSDPQQVPVTKAEAAEDAARKVEKVAWTGDLDGMIQRRVIRVLTTPSRINYFVDKAEQRGLIYDAFKLFENDLNTKLKTKHLRIHVVMIPVPHDQLIPALLAGRGDVVAAGVLLTDWRREKVDATIATRTNVSSIVVTGRGVPTIASPQDLAGRELYLRKSEVSEQGVDRFNAELAKAGKPPVRLQAAPEVLADEDILEMVNAGLVPMTVVDDYQAEFWAKIYPNLVLNRTAPLRTGMETGMLVRKGSPQLLAELNAFLKRNPKGSAQYNMLFQTYLKSQKYARDATSTAEREKFLRTVDLFRKYGDQYKLDALLIAAQGYQESRLDNNARSPVGAIGVMQVMPATGKDLGVGDITQLEPNIHAGVKYMRFMVDKYYEREPMDRLNKGLFTFASYNAGPGRVAQLRKRAAARGLDPNVWFNNVEVIAAESIGRETVQYVANIYKYYLAYTMLAEQRAERDRAKQAVKKGP
jgi:membrane-bound lytic murein transglycosylase MltF